MTKRKSIHFMGIGGSGMSAVSILAKKQGWKVTGCDIQEDSPYMGSVRSEGIEVFHGHDKKHFENVDIVAVTPAMYFQGSNNSEFTSAKNEKKLMTWQEFLGRELQKEKEVISIAGTHGKSTTTALASLLFENANLDPTVMVGAKVKQWGGNYRYGKGRVFITEADEFNDNFLHYSSDVVLLNNIEMDHFDYFKSDDQLYESFVNFIKRLVGKKVLIVNQDSLGIKKLFKILGNKFLEDINLYGYSIEDDPLVKVKNSIKAIVIERDESGTKYEIVSDKDSKLVINIELPGEYNVSNSLGVYLLAKLYGISIADIQTVFGSFDGIGRRMEKLGEKNGVVVYDDYAHHPTAIKVTLGALKQKHPTSRIIAIIEPHSYSRTKGLLDEYERVFDSADQVIIAPIYKARDNQEFGVSGRSIVDVSRHQNIKYIDDFGQIVKNITKDSNKGDVLVIMGAGNSYQLARDIYESL